MESHNQRNSTRGGQSSSMKKKESSFFSRICRQIFVFIYGRITEALKGVRRQFTPFIFALILFFFAAYYNSIIQVLIQNSVIAMGKTKDEPLTDIGFIIFPNLSTYTTLPDMYLLVMVLVLCVKTFFRRRFSCVLLILKRYSFIHAIIFIFRGTSIAITILPNPWDQCKVEHFPNVFLGGLLVILGKKRTCFDVFFSGHSAMITLTTLLWMQYETNIFIQLLWIPVALGGYFIMVATRFHYTSDVVYGTMLTLIVWGTYHYMARRLRSLAVQRSRNFGDLKVLSPLNEENGMEPYTVEEREYLQKIYEYKNTSGIYWRIKGLMHYRYSIPRNIATPFFITFFKWFECWHEDLEFEKRVPLLPTVNTNSVNRMNPRNESDARATA